MTDRETTVARVGGESPGTYELVAKLATGGMAELFLACVASVAGIERYVVLKRILRHRAADVEFVKMFLDEARLAAQLRHPNVAQVYDIGKLGESYFFTMEYVHGETVRTILQLASAARRPLPIAIALAIASGAAAGLHHAHERTGADGRPLGVVHRDVSPSNLMVSYEGNVKVVDFGIAKAAGRSRETRTGKIMGKIGYLSPEQCRGAAVDRRSDLFSLGIVLWELLANDRLFMRDSTEDFDILSEVVHRTPPLVSTRRPDVPKEVEAIVARLLARAPEDRFQTAEELLQAIDKTAVHQGVLLSSSALARFMRETCGQRREPWIAMKEQLEHTEVLTVTGEAIPDRLDTVLDDMMDSELARLPDLRRSASASPAEPTTAPVADSLRPDPPAIVDPVDHGRVWKARAWWFAALAGGALVGLVLALVLAKGSGRGEAVALPSASDASTVTMVPLAPAPSPADARESPPVELVAPDGGARPVEAVGRKPPAERPRPKPNPSKTDREPPPPTKPAKPDCARDPLACWR